MEQEKIKITTLFAAIGIGSAPPPSSSYEQRVMPVADREERPREVKARK